tara:strand:- start:249 stop:437 length:189 start_codon:yes stop_codon:yes gene_type:complete
LNNLYLFKDFNINKYMILALLAFATYFILLKVLKVPLNYRITNKNTTDYFLDYCDEPICYRI